MRPPLGLRPPGGLTRTQTVAWFYSAHWPDFAPPLTLDKDADFVAEHEGYGTVGRIYESLKPGSVDKHWFWAMNAFGPEISRNIGKLSGHAETPRQAAREVERSWFAAIEGSSLDVPVPPVKSVNSYAVAKGRE